MIPLETQRTRLRRLQSSDLENMILLESDPDIMKFTPSRFPLPPEKIESRLKSFIEKQFSLTPLGFWAAELKENKKFIGWFMVLKTDQKFPELGFMLVKEYWNKGFATEISQQLILHCFQALKLPGISAVTDHNNLASIHVLEKLSFQKIRAGKNFDTKLNKEMASIVFEKMPN